MIGKTVGIIASKELSAMKLNALVGRTGTVVAKGEKSNGYYVEFSKPYLHEKEWFIPTQSIQPITP